MEISLIIPQKVLYTKRPPFEPLLLTETQLSTTPESLKDDDDDDDDGKRLRPDRSACVPRLREAGVPRGTNRARRPRKVPQEISFQCEQCKCQLTALNVAAFDGKIFCKTHFHERLAHAGGKYDKAFRETTEAEEKEGRDKGSSKGDEKKKKKKKDNNNNNNNKTSVKSMAAKTNVRRQKMRAKMDALFVRRRCTPPKQ